MEVATGRWRFKGVPEPQEIYEVGEPGIAPLRVPPNIAQGLARHAAVAPPGGAGGANWLLVVAFGIGGWFVTRPQPAIAFAERDWVVVGDLRNLTGQSVLDDSLEQAFRISLEQSRYVNVLSDLKARDTLARMQRQPDTVHRSRHRLGDRAARWRARGDPADGGGGRRARARSARR